ncbi:MAG TPA: hypothetical protein PKM88_08245 [bacterium]|nr:hypothetical protein [bacterium]
MTPLLRALRFVLCVGLLLGGGCSCGSDDGPGSSLAPLGDSLTFAPGDGTSPGPVLSDVTTIDAAKQAIRADGRTAVPELIRRLRGGRGNYAGAGYPALIELLGAAGDTAAVAALVEVTDDRGAAHYATVLPWAICALRDLRDPAAVPALERILADPAAAAADKVLAAQVLGTLTGRSGLLTVPPPLQ